MLGNWVGMCASSLLILLALIYRMQREERAMIDTLWATPIGTSPGRALGWFRSSGETQAAE
jgi:hypothetical protein